MKRKFVVRFALGGLGVALVLTGIRLYILHYEPLYFGTDGGDWFELLTLIFWPGAFYLTVLQDKEPAKVVFVVLSIAILFNGMIYGAVGWLVWRFARFMELVAAD
jgi:hypothetical protein